MLDKTCNIASGPKKEIADAFESLSNIIGNLIGVTENLCLNLRTILPPENTNQVENITNVPFYTTELANYIDEQQRKISHAVGRLRFILEENQL